MRADVREGRYVPPLRRASWSTAGERAKLVWLTQKAALEGWVQEFRGDLGTALTDVVLYRHFNGRVQAASFGIGADQTFVSYLLRVFQHPG
jgi:hypothetical protein